MNSPSAAAVAALSDLPTANLRLVAADDLRALTSQAVVQVKSLSRRGAVLILNSPFIDDCHVLMDVHNIIPKLVELILPDGDGQTATKVGEVVRFNCLEQSSGSEVLERHFLLEVQWVNREPVTDKPSVAMWGPFGRALKPSRSDVE